MKLIVVDVEQDQGKQELYRPRLLDGGERHTLGAVEVKPGGVARLDLVHPNGIRYGTIFLYEHRGNLEIDARMTGQIVEHEDES